MLYLINTGVANIRSLQATFDRLGRPWQLTTNANQIAEGDLVVLPGVGAFAAAIDSIDRMNLRESILERIAADRPLLCICLGMQMLAESSEESPGVQGLGVIPRQIKRFSNNVQVPQLGWNEVRPVRNDEARSRKESQVASRASSYPFEPGDAYFANSYRLEEPPEGWGYAVTEYDRPFVSSLWHGRLLACQFHPELSGLWGETLIKRWLLNTIN
jgi:imidazole glycerol phosphate synthase glutamine amidotransferase subunit